MSGVLELMRAFSSSSCTLAWPCIANSSDNKRYLEDAHTKSQITNTIRVVHLICRNWRGLNNRRDFDLFEDKRTTMCLFGVVHD